MTAETPMSTEDADGAGGKMPLLDHLIELRSRLLKSLVAIGIAFGVCLYFAKPIFGVLVQPLVAAGQRRTHERSAPHAARSGWRLSPQAGR